MATNQGYRDDDTGNQTDAKPKLEQTLSMSKGDDGKEVDTSCGYLCCKPACSTSCCNTPKGLGVAISFFMFQYGIIMLGVVNIIVVPLQRRYQFTATQAAWVVSSQDFFAGFFAIVFGYIGTFVHKGRLLTLSAAAQFCGCSMFLIVHFISPLYDAGEAHMEVCDPENPPSCDFEAGAYDMYFWLLIFGQMLHGLAGGILWCIAVPYMDENMKASNTPLYIGIVYGSAALGAMVGYIVGGLLLTVYVDVWRVDMEDIDISPGDPRWVGAWWAPYILGVIGAFVTFIYVGAYPRYIPAAAKYQAERKTEAYAGGAEVSKAQSGVSQLWQSTKLILANPTFIFLIIAGIFESGLMMGFIVFFPAIITFQFDQNPAEAAIIAGIVIVPAAIGGQILGGLVPRWLNLKVRGLILQTGIMAFIVVLLSPVLLLRCPTPDIAGISVSFHEPNYAIDVVNMTVPCNEECSCDTRAYDPICGINDIQYFTPCHAGCLSKGEDEHGDELFYDCMCIPKTNETYDAVAGSCDSDCTLFPIFLAVFFFAVLSIFMGVTSGVAASVRCIPETERSYGTGLQSTIVRFLGNVPFPLMMGAIFDNSCLVWQYTCDIRGSCWLYDPAALSTGLMIVTLVAKVVACFCHAFAIYFYKPPPEEVHVVDIGVGHDFNVNYTECKPPMVDSAQAFSSDKVPNGVPKPKVTSSDGGRDSFITRM